MELTEQDGIGTLTSLERRLGQGLAMVVDPCTAEMVGFDVEREIGLFRDELEDSDGFGCYLGAYGTNEVRRGRRRVGMRGTYRFRLRGELRY